MEWINTDISKFNLRNPYALIVPGSAPSRPEKRWPKEKYAQLCQKLANQNIQPVLIGTKDEVEITQYIALGRNAQYAVGNDTGPMHMVGPTGCKTLVLFSCHSNPTRNAPMGDHVHTIQVKDFNDLDVQQVFNKLIT